VALVCPKCERGTLKVTAAIELAPTARADEMAVQMVACPTCSFGGVAVYEESRRGALDDEWVNHMAYAATEEGLRAARRLIRACPHKRDPRCGCASHRALADYGTVQGVEWEHPMPIVFRR